MNEDRQLLRKQIGVALRFPIVALLCFLWIVYLWWWIAGIGIVVAIVMLILRPPAYPILYIFTWLYLAFLNSKDPVLHGYWDDYPGKYIEWCAKSLKLGFPKLHRWLVEGFGS